MRYMAVCFLLVTHTKAGWKYGLLYAFNELFPLFKLY